MKMTGKTRINQTCLNQTCLNQTRRFIANPRNSNLFLAANFDHVIGIFLLSQSASENHSQEKRAHKPLHTFLSCLLLGKAAFLVKSSWDGLL